MGIILENSQIAVLISSSFAHGGHPVTPQTFIEAVELLPEMYKLTAGGERFLRYSGVTVENDNTTFMHFMSPVGHKNVYRANDVLCHRSIDV